MFTHRICCCSAAVWLFHFTHCPEGSSRFRQNKIKYIYIIRTVFTTFLGVQGDTIMVKISEWMIFAGGLASGRASSHSCGRWASSVQLVIRKSAAPRHLSSILNRVFCLLDLTVCVDCDEFDSNKHLYIFFDSRFAKLTETISDKQQAHQWLTVKSFAMFEGAENSTKLVPLPLTSMFSELFADSHGRHRNRRLRARLCCLLHNATCTSNANYRCPGNVRKSNPSIQEIIVKTFISSILDWFFLNLNLIFYASYRTCKANFRCGTAWMLSPFVCIPCAWCGAATMHSHMCKWLKEIGDLSELYFLIRSFVIVFYLLGLLLSNFFLHCHICCYRLLVFKRMWVHPDISGIFLLHIYSARSQHHCAHDNYAVWSWDKTSIKTWITCQWINLFCPEWTL